MTNKRKSALCAVVVLFLSSQAVPAQDLSETNRSNIDHNKGRIATIESNIAANSESLALNTQLIGLNGAAITSLQQQLEQLTPPPVYDFKDYAVPQDVTEKTFSMKGQNCADTETRQYNRTLQGDATAVRMVRVRSQAGIPCQRRAFEYIVNDENRQLLRYESYNASGSTLRGVTTLANPIVLRHNNMQIGQSWGGGTEVTLSPEPVFGAIHVLANQSTLLGVEDIAVGYNGGTTFSACLKIGSTRTSDTIGQFMRVEWFCPQVGLVKRIQNSLTTPPVALVWELTGMTR